MKHTTQFFLIIALLIFSVSSCKKDEVSTNCLDKHEQVAGKLQNNTNNANGTAANPIGPIVFDATPCGTPQVSDFYAGQNINVGSVSVSNTSTDLIVTITTTGGWVMGQTHVYVGTLAGMPTTGNGNPQICN